MHGGLVKWLNQGVTPDRPSESSLKTCGSDGNFRQPSWKSLSDSIEQLLWVECYYSDLFKPVVMLLSGRL